ncbi:MAG TPA: lipopolysaccharide biosynthesis protein [Erysipelotrichaceae bacterium]|jgi:O-antigen/teichoic acid export membrane protein|nr:lipopolysaccharide biosynthesis protein [Erysipelotrichaceae bacterium]HQA84859.1 lipopolysaccharide biosynthesis protein [Erysipelotrichaceae bacterium]
MNKKNEGNTIVSGMFWRFAERISAQGVSFVVSLILARLLTTHDFGVVAIILIFIDVANVFVTTGFGSALVQKKNPTDEDYSTIFFFNIVFSFFVYLVIFLLAPKIEAFYEISKLGFYLRLLALKIPISGFSLTQQAYVQKNMLFKIFFFSTVTGTIVSAALGIYLAVSGYGPLALVFQYLTNAFIASVVLWFAIDWRPKLYFSFKVLLPLFNYGWKILFASILHSIYMNLRGLVIGKFYTPNDLAFFNQGYKIPGIFVTNVNVTVDSVLFPVMSKKQDDKKELKTLVSKSLSISSIIIWPIMIGLLAVSKNLILIVLTEKWLPCLPFLWIACIQGGFEPIQVTNLQAIKSMGRSDLILIMEFIKKGCGILFLLLAVKHGVFAIALGGAMQTVVATFVNIFPNKKLLDYSYSQQIKDMLPAFVLASIMGVVVISMNYININLIILLLAQVFVGVVVYVLLVYVFQRETFNEVISLVKRRKMS